MQSHGLRTQTTHSPALRALLWLDTVLLLPLQLSHLKNTRINEITMQVGVQGAFKTNQSVL